MGKSGLSRIETTIRNHITASFGDREDLRFVVGASGGVDSMSLLYAFYRLGISAYVVHLNYQKRGSASRKDALLVARMARRWDFDYRIVKIDPEEAGGQNFQQWARDRRYRLFEELAEAEQADGIAVAHHRDDQVETVLLKMFRGGGLPSWSGMRVWDGRLFRPLLDIPRDEITNYASQNKIPYRTDASNLESDFARNFLRNEWLADLSGFFPGWEQNVLRISRQAKYYEQAIHWIAGQITDDHGILREAFHSLEPGVQKAVILFLLKKRNPDISVSRHSLHQLEAVNRLQTGKRIQLAGPFSLMRDRAYYRLFREQPNPFSDITISREQMSPSGCTAAGLSLTLVPRSDCPPGGEMLCMDPDKISWPITLRRWQDGDRFQPLGMRGRQLVSDHLTGRKVGAAEKREVLVITSFEETICAVIFPPIKNSALIGTVSEQVKYGAGTPKCIKITRYSR